MLGSIRSSASTPVTHFTIPSNCNTSPQLVPNFSSNIVLTTGLNLSAILSTDTNEPDTAGTSTTTPTRPRRLWNVSDSQVPILPPFYPPASRATSCYCGGTYDDASPSTVAVRIAECLRRRSVAAEYDEEAATCTALTVDRCAFVIRLWRVGENTAGDFQTTTWSQTEKQNNTTTILVECIRTRGPVQTFHWTVQAILQSAQALDNGDDQRNIYQSSPTEYVRWPGGAMATSQQRRNGLLKSPDHLTARNPKRLSAAALESLEHAFELVFKDRINAQILGMESLVALTDVATVGIDAALYVAVALLGKPLTSEATPLAWCDEGLHWLYRLIVHGQLPMRAQQQQKLQKQGSNNRSSPSRTLSRSDHSSTPVPNESSRSSCPPFFTRDSEPIESISSHEQHVGLLRSLALRTLTNALTLLSEHQAPLLEFLLKGTAAASHWCSDACIQALSDDLLGASRPPTLVLHVSSSRLASPHEAVMAVQCLGVLGAHNAAARKRILMHRSTLTLLERARHVGRSTHEKLHQEVVRVYEFLTEAERSC
jgi:hypothetical protein